jgi:hypothetical protein
MHAVKIAIVRFVDDHQPGFVECQLIDASGRCWSFIEKVPVVTTDWLDASSKYPQPGVIGCEVVEREGQTVTIDTTKPWAIESVEGETRFTVAQGLLTEL